MMNTRNYSEQLVIAAGQNTRERDYWLDKLQGFTAKSMFFYDFKKTGTNKDEEENDYRLESVEFKITGEDFVKLSGLISGSDYGLNVVLVTILTILLNKYTGSRDITVGTPIYKQDIEGEFVNTALALRNQVDSSMTFKTLLLQVRQTIMEAVENQCCPIEIVIRDLNLPLSGSDFPLFDIAVLLDNIHYKEYIRYTSPNMVFFFKREESTVRGMLEYNVYRYRESTAERIAGYFTYLAGQLLSHLDSKLSDIDWLPGEMKKQLLFDFNDTGAGWPRDKTIDELFESRVRQFPDRVAVVYHREQVTYGELNQRSNRLARLLRERGVTRDSIAAVIMEPSVEMVVGILGILKAGGAYLPIDVQYPASRVLSMLQDCRVSVILLKNSRLTNLMFSGLAGVNRIRQRPVVTDPRRQITDLDRLPFPDRSLVDYREYNRFIGISMVKNNISLQATRGCPYNCAYCHKIWPKRHISRSAENIFAEVKRYYDMGFRNFTFVDDIFNLDIKNSRRFFELILENNLKVHFHFPAGVRGDILTEDYIDLMVKAGTTSIALALETASPRLQRLIGKNLNIQRLRENARYFTGKYPHVILELFTIHGFPTETREEALLTLEFIKSLKWVHFPYFHILKIFPNTDMEKLALEKGISGQAIHNSENLAYHELPDTLPFEKRITLECQSEFFNGYFLSKERLLKVLPYQMKVLTEAELVQKYDSYLPVPVNRFSDLLEFTGIREEQLRGAAFPGKDTNELQGIHETMQKYFPAHRSSDHALRVLLLDLSQLFPGESDMLYDVVEAPLGLMYLLTYINRQFGSRVNGKIAKSRIDFDNYDRLKALLEEFLPDIIGIRTLTFYKEFFHRTVAMIANWGFDIPIIAGGPYAASDYERILEDPGVDLAVLGEGELTFGELIGKILENDNKLPGEEVLREIPGIAFVPGKTARTGSAKKNRSDIVIMDAVDFASPAGPPAGNPPKTGQSTDLAYIIFTSGSTGKPKGMMIEHRNLVRLMVNDKYPFDFSENDTWTLFHSYCFDFSVWEIFGPLVYGGKLAVISRVTARDPRQFLKILVKQRVTVLNQTPSAFYQLVNAETDSPVRGLALRYVIFGGEALAPIKLKPWWEKYPHIKFINMYGITETTVHVTFKEIGVMEVEENSTNIGRPIPTLTAYIMADNLDLLPVGVPGELFVGGSGVGRGYVNRPEMSVERFPRNPYKDETLYRSGDLVRLLPDGEMEYCGRVDHQVKIRGFRVEPGEIESLLLKHKDIEDAVVLAVEGKSQPGQPAAENKSICAYVVPSRDSVDKESGMDIPALRKYLWGELPDYMIPSYIVPLEKIPLTVNGKIDRQALPDPEAGITTIKGAHTAPRTETEKRLAALWAETLGIEKGKIGVDDNFFELGGHSLKAAKLEISMHKAFEIKVPMAEIFKTPTIKKLAVYVEKAAKDRYVSISPVPEREFYPLSSPQKRLFFLHQFQPENESYNVPFLCILEGKIDPGRMEKTFGKLIDRHESLRTSFLLIDTAPVQKVHQPREIEFAVEYYDAVNRDDIIQNFFRSFDLSTAPLLRVGLIKEEDQKHILMVDMHHIITDAFSMSIFIKEFTVLYAGQDLPPLRLQYKDYILWENSPEQQASINVQGKYWLAQFEGDTPPLLLPTDYPRPLRQNSRGSEIRFTLGSEECRKLKAAAVEENATLYMVLLALYNVLLSKLSGQESIIVGTAAAGRRHKDLESIIGYFLNTLPLWNFPAGEKTFLSFFREVKQTVLKAFENQDYPLDDLVEKVVKNRAANRMPLFDVILGVDKPEESPVKIPGLSLKPYPDYERKVSTYDLILLAYDMGETLSFRVKYKTTLFKEETIKRFITYFKNIVSTVLEDPLVKLKTIEIASEDEKEELYSMIEKDESEILIDFNL
jgi:amino acid adenylation domain-containing protein